MTSIDYISQLVCVLWWVNNFFKQAILPTLKFKLFVLPNYCLMIYRQVFLTFIASKNLKLSIF